MGASLEDSTCRALGPGADATQGHTLIDECLGDVEVLAAEVLRVLGVVDGRGDHLVDRFRSCLWGELQGHEGVVDVHTADQVNDATHLHRAHPHVPRNGVRAGTITEQGLTTGAVAVFFAHE